MFQQEQKVVEAVVPYERQLPVATRISQLDEQRPSPNFVLADIVEPLLLPQRIPSSFLLFR